VVRAQTPDDAKHISSLSSGKFVGRERRAVACSATDLRTWNFAGQNQQNAWYSSQNAATPDLRQYPGRGGSALESFG
jgi:hypothetical protein